MVHRYQQNYVAATAGPLPDFINYFHISQSITMIITITEYYNDFHQKHKPYHPEPPTN